jgi:hypothetical protein
MVLIDEQLSLLSCSDRSLCNENISRSVMFVGLDSFARDLSLSAIRWLGVFATESGGGNEHGSAVC